jgi:acetylornithine/N-succinyldiaminopimelate aminotransferase
MKPLDVYAKFPIAFTHAQDCRLFARDGRSFLDFYGGHGVISIGHSHPQYVAALTEQLNRIAFYTNVVDIPEQQEICDLLGELCGYPEYKAFFVNSGAEANENALKLASLHTGRSKVLAFKGAFHGRTALTSALTDLNYMKNPLSAGLDVEILPFGDEEALRNSLDEQVACVILEGIQGVGGIKEASVDFMKVLRQQCDKFGALLIVDEIQSGCGRTGLFFAHQRAQVRADLVTMAKGIGNGFPVAMVLCAPALEPKKGMLGTTFGGSYLACAAMKTVLSVLQSQSLISRAGELGENLKQQLRKIAGIKDVRGHGLMIGIDFEGDVTAIRTKLLHEYRMITGYSETTGTIRLLPPLTIASQDIDELLRAFAQIS